MAATTGPRKTYSVQDYPEHLNPFHEEDNHNKIRFWTIGKKLNRTNSISFSGIKDLKNSWFIKHCTFHGIIPFSLYRGAFLQTSLDDSNKLLQFKTGSTFIFTT
ncbi:hypothetical protein MSG28_011023 [Choristoneura fumiferana]|uniref:Uncharacterized protein n=1 Tax=Choristoneura fumiferana TaxID=7141 RepID=A0ACC0KQM2_CHOFU|nr:hypothetical protein MSG28_011023 [Choristoneura fumiferana]